MSTHTPTTSSRLEKIPDAPSPAPSRLPAPAAILLAGPEALALRGPIQKILADHSLNTPIDGAESILEAVLMSAGNDDDQATPIFRPAPLILAAVAQEIDQLEPAVRSLRKVYPHSRIFLLTDPAAEGLCRKAKSFGPSDYIILPADSAILRKLLAPNNHSSAPAPAALPPSSPASRKPAKPDRPTITPASLVPNPIELTADLAADLAIEPTQAELSTSDSPPAPNPAPAPIPAQQPLADPSLPALPLLVQAVLFNDLLLGKPDFLDRTIATLQTYVKWNGTLKFTPAEIPTPHPQSPQPTLSNHHHLSAPVGLAQQPPFGHLTIEPAPGLPQNPAIHASLNQAAHWLATLLSIARRYEQLRSLAITDELSGAYNRRYFTKFMNGLLERARSNRFRVTLLLFDIDDFKKYNDTFGHASGDAIIRELIKLLRSCTRPHDLVARLGGDEFACVYWDNEAPRTPNSEHPRDAISATERFRKAVENHQWAAACNIKGEVSISGGLATFPWDADSLEPLMKKADEALLRAKAAGKNVFLLHGQDCQKPTP